MTDYKGAVRDMCTEMTGLKVAFERVEARFFEHLSRNGSCRDLGHLTGKLAEIHTLQRAEEMERRHPKDITIYRLTDPTRREDQWYLPACDGTPNITIQNDRTITIGEIDLVMMVGGMPVIVETHVGSYRTYGRNSVAQVVRSHIIERKKRQVARLVGKRPEIVHVIPEEHLSRLQEQDSNLARYVQAGNYLIGFPMDRHQWRALAERFTFSLL